MPQTGDAVPVHKEEVAFFRKRFHCPSEGGAHRPGHPVGVYLPGGYHSGGEGFSFFGNNGEQLPPPPVGEFLAVVQQRVMEIRGKDNSRCNKRACQRPSSRFVNTGYAPVALPVLLIEKEQWVHYPSKVLRSLILAALPVFLRR